jgi:translocation and assembly module TamA
MPPKLRKMVTKRSHERSYWSRVCTSGCWLVLVLLASFEAGAAQLEIVVEGLSKELHEAVKSNLSLEQYAERDVTPAQIRRLFNSGEDELRRALEPYGYYDSKIESRLEETEKGFRAVYTVSPGQPVMVRKRKVEVKGTGAELRSVQRAVQRFKPEEGERLDHGQYEASKDAVQQALLSRGYLRAWTPVRKVEVSRSESSAAIDVQWLSGDRYKFGQVGFSGGQFSEDFLQRYVPWKPGDWYSSDQVLAFQQRLIDADYFGTVLVEPVLERGRPEGVPIRVELSPAKRTIYTAGVYMSTDTGPGVRASMARRWINKKGHKLSVDLDNAQRLENYGVKYVIPLLGPNDRSLNFGASYRDENTDTSQSRNTRIAANETRQWLGFTRTLGLQFLSGSFQIADEDRSSSLMFGEATLTRKFARNFAFPRNGYSIGLGTRFAPESALTDTSFTQVTLDAKYIKGTAPRQRLLLRASLGAMAVDDFDQLPPELRFFAGGDRSIRGFDYQQLGSRNAAGEVIGGTYLTVGSAEYEYFFLQDWGAVFFVDGGDAYRTKEFDLNIGAGLGARWRSPVGIVRVDFGIPVKSDEPTKLRFHISIGPDL